MLHSKPSYQGQTKPSFGKYPSHFNQSQTQTSFSQRSLGGQGSSKRKSSGPPQYCLNNMTLKEVLNFSTKKLPESALTPRIQKSKCLSQHLSPLNYGYSPTLGYSPQPRKSNGANPRLVVQAKKHMNKSRGLDLDYLGTEYFVPQSQHYNIGFNKGQNLLPYQKHVQVAEAIEERRNAALARKRENKRNSRQQSLPGEAQPRPRNVNSLPSKPVTTS